MDWLEIAGNWVLIPRKPLGIIHFLGGAFVATLPHLTYRRLLEFLAQQGYVVIATPFVNTFAHTTILKMFCGNSIAPCMHLKTAICLPEIYPSTAWATAWAVNCIY